MKKPLLLFVAWYIANAAFGQQTSKTQIDYFNLVSSLTEYKNNISESYHLIRSWVFIDKQPYTPGKIKLKDIHHHVTTNLNEKIKQCSYLLDSLDQAAVFDIIKKTDLLFQKQKLIMSSLSSFESYDNPLIIFDVVPNVEYDGAIVIATDTLNLALEKLISKKTIDFIEFISAQSSPEPLKIKKIKQLLVLMNMPNQIKEILSISTKTGLDKVHLEKNIYEILLQKYDRYYSIQEIDDLIKFYKTKTGKKTIKVTRTMLAETLTEIINTLK